ncbi:hypothetical protein LINPERPRIM_LOCUS29522 [Linum perenne]
MWYLLCPV